MDRKSFFKRALFAIGAAIVPGSVLKAIQKQEPVVGPPAIPFDNSTTLFWQMQALFPLFTQMKTTEFYWAEYDSCDIKTFKGPATDGPVTIKINPKDVLY
jgi:hypothetical protein